MSNPIHNSDPTPRPHAEGGGHERASVAQRRCDFCGDLVNSVRRVALDVEYDRLQKAHEEQYSCSDCFESKEARRLGLVRR